MSNSLDPDQARRFVRPDLGPNCLPRLSADGTGRQRVNEFVTDALEARSKSHLSDFFLQSLMVKGHFVTACDLFYHA